jgi:hypothetical protein
MADRLELHWHSRSGPDDLAGFCGVYPVARAHLDCRSDLWLWSASWLAGIDAGVPATAVTGPSPQRKRSPAAGRRCPGCTGARSRTCDLGVRFGGTGSRQQTLRKQLIFLDFPTFFLLPPTATGITLFISASDWRGAEGYEDRQMNTTYSQEKIAALMGIKEPIHTSEWIVAAHVIDGILENDDINGCGFGDWTVSLALETYATETFLANESIDANDVDWEVVQAAVKEALNVLNSPEGFTLINQNDGYVWACGATLDDAKAELGKAIGHKHHFVEITRQQYEDFGHTFHQGYDYDERRYTEDQCKYLVVRGPLPEGGWEARDGHHVVHLGEIDSYQMASWLLEKEAA